MKVFSEQDLYDWPLTANSVVMDVGGNHGQFTHFLNEKFDPTIHVYEPVPEFYAHLCRRFESKPKVTIHNFGLGAADGVVKFGVGGEMSGVFCALPSKVIEVLIRDVADVRKFLPARVALLTMNCEGGEYDILERLLDSDLIRTFDAIVVQFHTTAPDYADRLALIMARLSFSHELLFDAPYCWTGWRLKK